VGRLRSRVTGSLFFCMRKENSKQTDKPASAQAKGVKAEAIARCICLPDPTGAV
jgi:hypothetical protein